MAKVSIVIPIYNAEKYIRQCLDSCTNQTLKDIEIICVNDESSDNSLEIINEYAQKDSRIKVINQKNQGTSMSRNNGMDIATGEYILFLDNDDWLELDCCELAYNQAQKNNNDYVWFNYSVYDEESGKLIEFKSKLEKLAEISSINLHELKNYDFMPNGYIWNKLFKLKWLIEHNIRYIKVPWEDASFLVQAMLNSTSISVLSKSLHVYRWRKDNTTHKTTAKQVFESKNTALQLVLEDKKPGKILDCTIKFYINSLIYWYNALPMKKQDKRLYKKLLIENFSKLLKQENIPYKGTVLFYILLLRTNVYPIYFLIRKTVIFVIKLIKKIIRR